MKIAIEGCAHGQLDNIYDSIQALETEENIKINLLICCGDFQSVRNESDLRCMAIPIKYYDMCSFYKYYSGEKEAPVLTIFIGGNHEASNYLQELPFGGWVAKNIYYLGYAGVINIGGLRIGGISGIYKGHDYMKGHFEMTPYSDDALRSVYHIRNIEVYRLKQVSKPLDIFLSHDWPTEITKHGDENQLLKFKPFFKNDIECGKLGSPPCNELLNHLEPKYWFAAHLHCKFAALVEHDGGNTTKFLALDKCLPNKRFLQIIDIETDEFNDLDMSYDLEWLTVLYLTDHLFSVKNCTQYMPSKAGQERWQFVPTDNEKKEVFNKFGKDLTIPQNFKITANSYLPDNNTTTVNQPAVKLNPQTTHFCKKLGITNPCETIIKLNGVIDLDELSKPSNNAANLSHSYIDDTDTSIDLDESFSLSPIKKCTMILPEPVNKTENFDNLHDAEIRIPAKTVEVVHEETKPEDKPVNKKFKRRNADIYENVNE